MPAIVTTNFRLLNAQNFKDQFNSNSVYIGIGKSDAWSDSTSDTVDGQVPVPGDNIDDINEAYEQLIGISKIADAGVSNVVPRHNWVANGVYSPWDSNDNTIYDDPFYVITGEFKVYKLLYKPAGSQSTVQPVHSTPDPLAAGDGHLWKYMYTLSTSAVSNFLTTSYMPVSTITVNPNDGSTEEAQFNSQASSAALGTAQGIRKYVVTSGGTGYGSGNTTVTVTGNGTGATATATIVGGAITEIVTNGIGSGYTQANVVITNDAGAVGATVRAVLEPGLGHGTDPVNELGGFFVGVKATLDGAVGTITTSNDFRQISLIKNPTSSGSVITDDNRQTLKSLSLSGAITGNINVDDVITSAGLVSAYVVEVDSSAGIIYYYQNDKTGYGSFVDGDTLSATSGGTATVDTAGVIDRPMDENSGEMIFLENRDPISRSATQIEDIKLIIEF